MQTVLRPAPSSIEANLSDELLTLSREIASLDWSDNDNDAVGLIERLRDVVSLIDRVAEFEAGRARRAAS